MAPKLAEVVTLYDVNVVDVAGMLRKLADDLEGGKIEADAIVCVLSGPDLLKVRGFGHVDSLQAMAYLSLAQARMCNGTLAQIDGDD
jgi:hypothetical protein